MLYNKRSKSGAGYAMDDFRAISKISIIYKVLIVFIVMIILFAFRRSSAGGGWENRVHFLPLTVRI